jgi:hypothetical protein
MTLTERIVFEYGAAIRRPSVENRNDPPPR